MRGHRYLIRARPGPVGPPRRRLNARGYTRVVPDLARMARQSSARDHEVQSTAASPSLPEFSGVDSRDVWGRLGTAARGPYSLYRLSGGMDAKADKGGAALAGRSNCSWIRLEVVQVFAPKLGSWT